MQKWLPFSVEGHTLRGKALGERFTALQEDPAEEDVTGQERRCPGS